MIVHERRTKIASVDLSLATDFYIRYKTCMRFGRVGVAHSDHLLPYDTLDYDHEPGSTVERTTRGMRDFERYFYNYLKLFRYKFS